MGDEELRGGEVVRTSLGLPMLWSGNFADVYKIHCPATGSTWALKCFTRQVRGLQERYRSIAAQLEQARLPFTVDFQYLEQGIRISGKWFPALKMLWVEGLTLNQFVEEHLERPANLQMLLDLWVKMAARLRDAGIAHADLQHGNVLLVPMEGGSLALRLIDYDGMYVPSLAGSRSGEVGHPAYQHPQRLHEGTFNAEVDRFSHLVIYTAIRSIMAGGRDLWRRFNNDDNLLFRDLDFSCPATSEVFRTLWQGTDPDLQALSGRLILACAKPLEQVPLINEIAVDNQVLPLSRDQWQQIDVALGLKGRSVVASPVPVVSASPPAARPSLEMPSSESHIAARRFVLPSPPRMLRRMDRALATLVGEGNTILRNSIRGVIIFCLVACVAIPIGITISAVKARREIARAEQEAQWATEEAEALAAQEAHKAQESLEEAERVRREADALLQAKCGRTLALQKATEAAFETKVRPASFQKGLERLLDATRAQEQTNYESADRAFEESAALFRRSRTEAPLINELAKAMNAWSAALTATNKDLLENYASQRFAAARRKAASAAEQAEDEKPAEASAAYREATDLLNAAAKEAISAQEQVAAIAAQLQAAVAQEDRARASRLLAEFAKLCPQDPRLPDMWKKIPGLPLRTFKGHNDGVRFASFSPEGRRLLTTSLNTTTLWDTATGEEIRTFNLVYYSAVFSPDGLKVLTKSGGSIQLWDAATGRQLNTMRLTGRNDSAVFSPDSLKVLTRSEDGTSTMWDAATGRQLNAFEGSRSVFSPDGLRVLTSSKLTTTLRDAATGEELHAFEGYSQAFSPDGRRVLTGSKGGYTLWDAATGKRLHTFDRGEGDGSFVGFSPDGGRMLTWSWSTKTTRLWDAATGEQLQTIKKTEYPHFSPDGRQVLAGYKETALLWDAATDRELRTFQHSVGGTFSPDGRQVLTRYKETAVLWDATTGRELRTFHHSEKVNFAVFSPDGRQVLTGSDDRTRLWDATVMQSRGGPYRQEPEKDGEKTEPPLPDDDPAIVDSVRKRTKPKTTSGAERQNPRQSDGPQTPPPNKEIVVDLRDANSNLWKMEMVLIPAGEFLMGSPDSAFEKPQHRVRITKPFYLGKYPVRQWQWTVVMGNYPSHFRGRNNPVEWVTWDDCQQFLDKLNADSHAEGGKFQLPTEAQWEYACRAGSTTRYCFGDDEDQLGEYAWYGGKLRRITHPVGTKKPNAWGLYDMHGNVSEWCQDWYAKDYYAKSVTDDPTGPTSGLRRVHRGGGWDSLAKFCRSASRASDEPGSRGIDRGFRVARVLADK